MKHIFRLFCVGFLFGGSASATIISMNITDAGSADSTMSPTDVAGAGAARADNWNNVAGAAGTVMGNALPFYDDGSPTAGATVDFTTDLANFRLGHAVANGDDRMWKGYLDIQAAGSLTFNNLEFDGAYDVYVYFDGVNGAQWRVAEFTIGAAGLGGEDSENTSWGAGQNTGFVYQQPVAGAGGNQPFPTSPNNREGNYVLFSGVTGSSFTLNAAGGSTQGLLRAPINGVQIVGTVIPEPSSLSMVLLGLASIIAIRRRSAL